MKAMFLLSMMFCCLYAADEFQVIDNNLSDLKEITAGVLSLPCNDTTTLFLKYLVYQSHIHIFDLTLSEAVEQLAQEGRGHLCIATFFAIYFDWQKVRKAIYDKKINVEILPEEHGKINAFFDQYCLTLRHIDTKMRALPEDKMLNLWLGLLIFEFEKNKEVSRYDDCVFFKKRIIDWFKGSFPQGAYEYCKRVAEIFDFSRTLKLLQAIHIDAFMKEIPESEKRLSKERYFALWKVSKGDANAIPAADFPIDGISCKDMVTYAKKMGCLHYFMLCANHRQDYSIDLSNKRIDTLEGVETIPTPSQCGDFSIDHNSIVKVPPFDMFSNLRKLSLSHNYLVTFPVVLKTLKLLEKLQLNNNQIQIFPADVEGFNALEELNLGVNFIRLFPTKVVGFKKLKTLNMERNSIEDIPRSVEGLGSVTRLYLHGNNIKACPFLIKGMEQIKTFLV